MKLKKGDLVRCNDAENAANVADALSENGIEWDFVYEHDGEQGIWIEIQEDEP